MGTDARTEAHTGSARSGPPPRSRLVRVRAAIGAAASGVVGLAPHVIHHLGPIAGAALLTGVVGTFVFALVGFLLTIPFLLRLRRRFGSWRAPAIALVAFAAVFALSSFVVGPLLSGHSEG